MAQLVTHESCDVDDQAEALTGWRQSYEQLGCGRFHGSVRLVMMAGGMLLHEATNRPLREEFVPPPEHIAIAVPLAVEPGSVFAGRPLERESLMVLSGDDEYEVVTAGELDLIGMSIHRDALRALAPAKAEWLARAGRERNLVLAPETAAAIRHMFLAASRSAEAGIEALAEAGEETALLTSTLEHTLMLAMSGERGAPSTIPRRAHARLQIVRRAIDFMRAHLHDDIGVPEVCGAAFASRRTLQYCFEEFLHTTPQAYLRALRLNEARRQLKAKGGQPITDIAADYGFASASHFTRHYKLMFDELPSQTLRLHGLVPGTA